MTESNDSPSQIIVNANPAQDQLEAGVRQFLAVVGLVLPIVGLIKYSGLLSILVANSTTVTALISAIIGLGALIWGQWNTRVLATKAAAMANKLPQEVASTK